MRRVFISHSAKDKYLAENLVSMLVTGIGVQVQDIFCTSIEGMRIPPGNNFSEFIKEQIGDRKVVMFLVSTDFLASEFCSHEIGAAWALDSSMLPLIVPPLNVDALPDKLKERQVTFLDKPMDLSDLRDRLAEILEIRNLATSVWEKSRNQFLDRARDLWKETEKTRPVQTGQVDSFDPISSMFQSIDNGAEVPEPSAIISLENKLQEICQQKFTFLIMGRTGVGKSSAINSLFNEQIATVRDGIPGTLKVKVYQSPIQKNIEIIDTPGLCDRPAIEGNDDEYIDKIRKKVKQFHCLLFVTPIYETRMRPDEIRAISLITEALGEAVWGRSIIVFTFSDYLPITSYDSKLAARTIQLRKELSGVISRKIADKIPAVAISNELETNPDGNSWYENFFVTIAARIEGGKALPFVLSIARRKPKLRLSESQKRTVREAVERSDPDKTNRELLEIATAAAAGGAMGGALAGPPGAVAGALLGALGRLFFG